MPRSKPEKFHLTEAPLIKVGAKGIGKSEAQTAIKRNVAGLIEMNEYMVRERMKSRAAAQKEGAPFVDALESLLKQQKATALKEIRRESLSLNLQSDLARDEERKQGQQSLLMQPLNQNLNFLIPPYDYEWNWGNPTSHVSDKQTGKCSVFAQSPITGAAASGIGLLLTTDKPAIVFVRPYIPDSWDWAVKSTGIFSSAEVRGGIDASAWVDGALCTPVRRDQAFSERASGFDGERRGDGGGTAWLNNIELNFIMSPGKTYAVSFGTWVECEDHSGIGGAGSAGRMNGTVVFVVVERYVGG